MRESVERKTVSLSKGGTKKMRIVATLVPAAIRIIILSGLLAISCGYVYVVYASVSKIFH